MFSRAELAHAIRFISPQADRVDMYYDAETDFVRIFVATAGFEALGSDEMSAVCMVVRDFVPAEVSVEVVTVGGVVVLGSSGIMVLT